MSVEPELSQDTNPTTLESANISSTEISSSEDLQLQSLDFENAFSNFQHENNISLETTSQVLELQSTEAKKASFMETIEELGITKGDMVSIGVSLVPVVGDVYDAVSMAIGHDLITWDKMSGAERMAGIAFTVIGTGTPISGTVARRAVKVLEDVGGDVDKVRDALNALGLDDDAIKQLSDFVNKKSDDIAASDVAKGTATSNKAAKSAVAATKLGGQLSEAKDAILKADITPEKREQLLGLLKESESGIRRYIKKMDEHIGFSNSSAKFRMEPEDFVENLQDKDRNRRAAHIAMADKLNIFFRNAGKQVEELSPNGSIAKGLVGHSDDSQHRGRLAEMAIEFVGAEQLQKTLK